MTAPDVVFVTSHSNLLTGIIQSVLSRLTVTFGIDPAVLASVILAVAILLGTVLVRYHSRHSLSRDNHRVGSKSIRLGTTDHDGENVVTSGIGLFPLGRGFDLLNESDQATEQRKEETLHTHTKKQTDRLQDQPLERESVQSSETPDRQSLVLSSESKQRHGKRTLDLASNRYQVSGDSITVCLDLRPTVRRPSHAIRTVGPLIVDQLLTIRRESPRPVRIIALRGPLEARLFTGNVWGREPCPLSTWIETEADQQDKQTRANQSDHMGQQISMREFVEAATDFVFVTPLCDEHSVDLGLWMASVVEDLTVVSFHPMAKTDECVPDRVRSNFIASLREAGATVVDWDCVSPLTVELRNSGRELL